LGAITEIRRAHTDGHAAVVLALVDVGPGDAAGADGVPADFGLDAGVDGAERGRAVGLHLLRDVIAGFAVFAGVTTVALRAYE
jgi:hypothetical protein